MVNSFLDPVLGWVLYLNPLIGIIVIAFLISLIVTLAMKFLTDQKLMKDLKQELKELQNEMKNLRNNPKKMAKVNTQFMETNMKYMSHSMRPTLFTFLPIIIIFAWLNSHMAYHAIAPGEPFQLTVEFEDNPVDLIVNPSKEIEMIEGPIVDGNEVHWRFNSSSPGQYYIILEGKNGTNISTAPDGGYHKEVIISNEREYAPVEKDLRQGFLFFMRPDENNINYIRLDNEKIKPFQDIPVLEDIPWVKDWGWLGAYILFSVIFSMGMRRIFKIY